MLCLVLGGLVAADTDTAWQVMLSQPLPACSLAGILLGNPAQGVMIGVLLLIGGDLPERLLALSPPRLRPLVERTLRVQPPAALGSAFIED